NLFRYHFSLLVNHNYPAALTDLVLSGLKRVLLVFRCAPGVCLYHVVPSILPDFSFWYYNPDHAIEQG
ncbi:MAG: hypothetical protein ACK5NG_02655, partial [Chthoniobacterales bacterium]